MINPLISMTGTAATGEALPLAQDAGDSATAFAAVLQEAENLLNLPVDELPAGLSEALPEELRQLLSQHPDALQQTLTALGNDGTGTDLAENPGEETLQALALISQWLAASLPPNDSRPGTGSSTAGTSEPAGLSASTARSVSADTDALQQLVSALATGAETGKTPAGAPGDLEASALSETSGQTATSSIVNGSLVTDVLKKEGPTGSHAGTEIAGLSAASHSSAANTVAAADNGRGLLQMQSALGSAGWQDEFDQQMLGMTLRGDRHVALHLNPRELGPLMIDLKMSDNQAHLHFLSSHPQVRSAVEAALPHLREALDGQGITLGDTSVSHQDARHNDNREQAQPTGITALPGSTPAAAETVTPPPSDALPVSGRVNLYI